MMNNEVYYGIGKILYFDYKESKTQKQNVHLRKNSPKSNKNIQKHIHQWFISTSQIVKTIYNDKYFYILKRNW